MSTQDETEDPRAPMSDKQIDELFGAGTAAKVREAMTPQEDQQRSTELIARIKTTQVDRVTALVDSRFTRPSRVCLLGLKVGESAPISDEQGKPWGFVLRTAETWELRRYVQDTDQWPQVSKGSPLRYDPSCKLCDRGLIGSVWCRCVVDDEPDPFTWVDHHPKLEDDLETIRYHKDAQAFIGDISADPEERSDLERQLLKTLISMQHELLATRTVMREVAMAMTDRPSVEDLHRLAGRLSRATWGEGTGDPVVTNEDPVPWTPMQQQTARMIALRDEIAKRSARERRTTELRNFMRNVATMLRSPSLGTDQRLELADLIEEKIQESAS